MNLDNLNLVELNAQEVKEVEGGNPIVKRVIGYALGAIGVYDAWSDFKAGWNSVK
jgi:hypothetical protein